MSTVPISSRPLPLLRPLQRFLPLGCAATLPLPAYPPAFPVPISTIHSSSHARGTVQWLPRPAVMNSSSTRNRESRIIMHTFYRNILAQVPRYLSVLNGHVSPLFAPSAWCAHSYVRASRYLLLGACPTAYYERCFVGTRTSSCWPATAIASKAQQPP